MILFSKIKLFRKSKFLGINFLFFALLCADGMYGDQESQKSINRCGGAWSFTSVTTKHESSRPCFISETKTVQSESKPTNISASPTSRYY